MSKLPHWSSLDKHEALNPANYTISIWKLSLMLLTVPGIVLAGLHPVLGPGASIPGGVLLAIGFGAICVLS